jgi:type IV secretory pathway TrbL component
VLVAGYQFTILHMHDLRALGLNASTEWGRRLGTGVADQAFDVTQPSTVMRLGGEVAFPALMTDDMVSQAAAAAKMVVFSPDRWAGILILLAFALVGVHLVKTVIEYYLAFGAAMVLVPWGVWNTTSSLAEGGIGWLAGSFVRLFLTITMVSLGLGVFRAQLPAADWGFADLVSGAQWWAVIVRVVAAWIFCVLCWVVPGKAANRMGGFALGLSGSTTLGGAMGTARIGMAMHAAGQAVNRGTSRMVARSQA